MQNSPSSPAEQRNGVVLCISGHDPSGGAGIQADIETLQALGQPAASLITCLTAQNSYSLRDLQTVDVALLQSQADTLLADQRVSGIKLGALGNGAVARFAAGIIRRLRETQPDLPVVVDPVLVAGSGGELGDEAVVEVLLGEILPLATLATPNQVESQRLGPSSTLLEDGCQWLLLTDTDSSSGKTITHRLHGPGDSLHTFEVPRLPGAYHGSGCTLASALAGYLAQGETVPDAVSLGLDFTHHCLEQARVLGAGQLFPNRRWQ